MFPTIYKYFNVMKRLFIFSCLFVAFAFISFGQNDTIKILAIGNSFSEDAVEEHLHELATAEGLNVLICNMYIGGCSIERHVKNIRENLPDYRYRLFSTDGKMTEIKGYTIDKVLADDDWDYISVQQSSPLSGEPQSYELLPELLSYIRERVPADATLMFHMTWAYSHDSTHKAFVNYGKDQYKMYNAIVSTVTSVIPPMGINLIIPAGTAIQNGRTSSLLSKSTAGDELTRDGYHLSRPHGRYVAACTWLEAVLGVNPVGNKYYAEGMTKKECKAAQKAAHKAVKHPYKISKVR